MKNSSIFFSIMASMSIVAGGAMYLVYGVLPHQYYLVTSLGIMAVAGLIAYVFLAKNVQF